MTAQLSIGFVAGIASSEPVRNHPEPVGSSSETIDSSSESAEILNDNAVPNHQSNSSMITRFRTTSLKGGVEPEPPRQDQALSGERRDPLTLLSPSLQSRAAVPAGSGGILVSAIGNQSGTGQCEPLTAGSEQLTLRPYQTASIEKVGGEFKRGIKRTLLVLPTGTGKTVVFAEIIRQLLAELGWDGARALVIAHRTELLDQAHEKLTDAGVRASVEQGQRIASGNAQAVVASVQTMQRARLAKYAPDAFRVIVIDEAHHAPAVGYQNIVDHFPGALVLGVTATPQRMDGKALGKFFETVAYTYDLRKAIHDEWLVPIRARRVRITDVDMSAIKTSHGDLAQDELSLVLREAKALQGVVGPLVQLVGSRKTLVFAVDVAHAHALTEMLNKQQPGCAIALDGKAPTAQRKAVLGLFRRGSFQFLVNCALFTEGFDEPSIECVAMARPTMSLILYMQMIGRGTRLLGRSYAESCASGKREVLLLDFVGNTRHRLAGPADALAGAMLTEEEQAEVDKELANGKTADIELVLAAAEEAAAAKLREKALLALAHYKTKEIDPFLGDQMPPLDPNSPAAKKPATDAQLAAIEKANLGKPPAGLTLGEASAILDALAERRRLGLATVAQCKVLNKLGLETKTMTMARAGQLMGMAHKRGFKPWVFAHEPEFRRDGKRS